MTFRISGRETSQHSLAKLAGARASSCAEMSLTVISKPCCSASSGVNRVSRPAADLEMAPQPVFPGDGDDHRLVIVPGPVPIRAVAEIGRDGGKRCAGDGSRPRDDLHVHGGTSDAPPSWPREGRPSTPMALKLVSRLTLQVEADSGESLACALAGAASASSERAGRLDAVRAVRLLEGGAELLAALVDRRDDEAHRDADIHEHRLR